MNKTAILFPGHGSQYVGMAADLFESDPAFVALINLSSELSSEDCYRLCLRGPELRLRYACFLQPILVSVCISYFRHFNALGERIDFVCGHSLGEIAALAAAGVVSDEDAVRIAAKRGRIMDECASRCTGGILAVLFAQLDHVKAILDELNAADRIVLANENGPDQFAISGDLNLLGEFARIIADRKQGKTKLLPVSGPWHSPFISSGLKEFEQWVEKIQFSAPRIPLVMNASAKSETDPQIINKLSTGQLISPVNWRQSMDFLRSKEVTNLIEIGPGRVLAGLARSNGFKKETRVVNFDSLNHIEKHVVHCA